jgi:hypothetical protein
VITLVNPVVQTEGCCGRGAVAVGMPNVSPGSTPPMIYLVARQADQLEVAVGDIEVLLVAEIVIDAPHVIIGSQGLADAPQKSLGVVGVAAQRIVFQRHLLAPDLIHDGVEADAAGVAGASRALRRMIADAVPP